MSLLFEITNNTRVMEVDRCKMGIDSIFWKQPKGRSGHPCGQMIRGILVEKPINLVKIRRAFLI